MAEVKVVNLSALSWTGPSPARRIGIASEKREATQ